MRTSLVERRGFTSQREGRIRRVVRWSCLAALAMCSFAGKADTLWLLGGEKLVGKLISQDNTKVVFQSQTLGTLEIVRDRIERIERDTTTTKVAPISTNQTTTSAGSIFTLTNQFLPWTAGPAGSEAFDWIQLKSGEWLAGKIK